MSDEYYGFDDDDFDLRAECDCSDEDWDMLEATAKCWTCGNSRSLSTAEIDNYWRAQTQFERDMERQMFWDRVRNLWWRIRSFFSFRRAAETPNLDDDIPF